MPNLFDDEIISVIMKFSNPNRGEIQDADRMLAKLSLSLDNVIRKEVASGKAISNISEGLGGIARALGALEKNLNRTDTGAGRIVTSAQKILGRYTPQRLEKMSEYGPARVTETSGTAALRRELAKWTPDIARMIESRSQNYERITKGQKIGRGMLVDVETTGLNKFRHQIIEATGAMFEYSKVTGEVTKVTKVLTGYLPLLHQAVHQFLPMAAGGQRRLTPGEINRFAREQPFSRTSFLQMARQSDFLAGHHAPFDRERLSRLIPDLAGMPWIDTLRDIPWRSLGHRDRRLQSLLTLHGIDPGQAHRSESDVLANIRLLGSRHPSGGPTYLEMALGRHGVRNKSQEILDYYRQLAEEQRDYYQSRLGERRQSYGIPEVRARRPIRMTDYGVKRMPGQSPESTPMNVGTSAIAMGNRVLNLDRFIADATIMGGPASSRAMVSIIRDKHQYEEARQRYRGSVSSRDFVRPNLTRTRFGDDIAYAVMAGTSTNLRLQRDEERRGDIGAMRFRSRSLSSRYTEPSETYTYMQRMLGQGWAQNPPQKGLWQHNLEFSSEEIDRFVEQARKDPTPKNVQRAAQMAQYVGAQDPRFFHLAGIMQAGQAEGRRIKLYGGNYGGGFGYSGVAKRIGGAPFIDSGLFRRVQGAAAEAPPPPFSTHQGRRSFPTFESAIAHLAGENAGHETVHIQESGSLFTYDPRAAEVRRMLETVGTTDPTGATARAARSSGQGPQSPWHYLGLPSPEGAPSAGQFRRPFGSRRGSATFDFLTGGLRGLFGQFGGGGGANVPPSPGPSPGMGRNPYYGQDPAYLRYSVREDALKARVLNLQAQIDKAAKAFAEFDKVTKPARETAAKTARNERLESIKAAQDMFGITSGAQVNRLRIRSQRLGADLVEGHANVDAALAARQQALGFNVISSEVSLADAAARQEKAKARIEALYRGGKIKRDEYDARLLASGKISQGANLRLAMSRFQYESSGVTDQGKLEQLRRDFSLEYAFGLRGLRVPKKGEVVEPSRMAEVQEQADVVYGYLGGRTLAQQAEARKSRLGVVAGRREDDIQSQIKSTEARARVRNDKFRQDEEKAERRFQDAKTKITEDGSKRRIAAEDRERQNTSKMQQTVESFQKREAARGGVGGGGGAGGRGGRRGGGFGGRAGYLDMGLGLTAVAGFMDRSFPAILSMAQYAAQVQVRELATKVMAKNQGLDVPGVLNAVQRVRGLGFTTMASNEVAQRMMFAQLDVAKAPQLARVAQNVSVLTGQTPSETLERLITAISSGLTMNLHRMGLPITMTSVTRQLKAERKAEGLPGQPTEVERRQALLNRVIQESTRLNGLWEKSLMTAGGQTQLLAQRFQELENSVGKGFLPAYGKAISMMGTGIKFFEEHTDVATKTSAAFAGAAFGLSTVGTLGLANYMLTQAPIPLPLKILGGIAGYGAYKFLTPDAGAEAAARRDTAVASLNSGLIARGLPTLDQIQNPPLIMNPNTVAAPIFEQEPRTAWQKFVRAEIGGASAVLPTNATGTGFFGAAAVMGKMQVKQTDDTKAAVETQIELNRDLTEELATQYDKRLRDFDDYWQKSRGKQGLKGRTIGFFENLLNMGGAQELGYFDLKLGPGKTFEERIRSGGNQRILSDLSKFGIPQKDILDAYQARQKTLQMAQTPEGASLLSQSAQRVQFMGALFDEAEQQAVSLEQKYGPMSPTATRAKKLLGTPAQKARIDYEMELEKFDAQEAYARMLDKLPDTDPEKIEFYKSRGGGSIEMGKARVKRLGGAYEALRGQAAEDYRSEMGRITTLHMASIANISSQAQVARIQAAITPGSYASEAAAMQAVFQEEYRSVIPIGQAIGTKFGTHPQDPLAQRQALSQAAANYSAAYSSIQARKRQGVIGRTTDELMDQAMLRQRAIYGQQGLSSQEAIVQSARAEQEAISKMVDDEERLNRTEELRRKTREKLLELASQEAQVTMEASVESAKGRIGYSAAMYSIVNATQFGANPEVVARENIEATRQAELQKVDVELKAREDYYRANPQALGETPLQQMLDELRATAEKQRQQVNIDARVQDAQEVAQQIMSRRSYGVDLIRSKGALEESFVAGMAVSPSEEIANIERIHQIRLKYIDEEAKARGTGLDVERQKAEETLQAESDKLKAMMDQRKEYFDRVRSFSEGLFETAMTEHGRGVRDYLVGQVRGLGAKVFGNLVTMGMEKIEEKGGTTLFHPKPGTTLAKIFGGTILGGAPTRKEIEAQYKTATEANTDATKTNTDALKMLTDLLKQIANVQNPQASPTMAVPPSVLRLPGPGGLPVGFPPLFGGGGGVFGGSTGNPFVFSAAPAMRKTGFNLGAGMELGSLALGAGRSQSSAALGGISPIIDPSILSGFNLGAAPGVYAAVPSPGDRPSILLGSPNYNPMGDFNASAAIDMGTPSQAASASARLAAMVGASKSRGAAGGGGGGFGGLGGLGNILKLPGIFGGGAGSGGGVIGPGGVGAPNIPITGGGAVKIPGAIQNSGGGLSGFAGKYGGPALMAIGGGLQAFKSFGHGGGGRGLAFGIGGGLQTAAGIAAMIPGGQLVALGLEAAALISDLVGGMMQDPREARANQIQNYLAANQYLAPTKRDLTYDLQGNLVSESGTKAFDTGILFNTLKASNPYLLQTGMPGFFSQPLSSLFGANKPFQYQVNPNYTAPASSYSGSQQYSYTQVPGQVLYGEIPAGASPINFNLHVSAMDSKNIIDRSSDIAAAVQKELMIGNGLSTSLQNSIFGAG